MIILTAAIVAINGLFAVANDGEIEVEADSSIQIDAKEEEEADTRHEIKFQDWIVSKEIIEGLNTCNAMTVAFRIKSSAQAANPKKNKTPYIIISKKGPNRFSFGASLYNFINTGKDKVFAEVNGNSRLLYNNPEGYVMTYSSVMDENLIGDMLIDKRFIKIKYYDESYDIAYFSLKGVEEAIAYMQRECKIIGWRGF